MVRRLLVSALLSTSLVACIGGDQEVGPAVDVSRSPVIVGEVDWVDTTELPSSGAAYAASRAVGLLQIPAAGVRCTAFLVADDLLMTNNHCVETAAEARGATAAFNYEQGTSWTALELYRCDQLVLTDEVLDFSLLRCQPRSGRKPGERQGVVVLEDSEPSDDQEVYLIHQNCDYYTDPNCDYTKKFSPGEVTGLDGDFFHHVADALGGSSGSPVFSAETHRVIGLHHAGWGDRSTGRGWRNEAIEMVAVAAAIRAADASLLPPPPEPPDQDPPQDPDPVEDPDQDPPNDPPPPGDPVDQEPVLRSDAVDVASPHPYSDHLRIEHRFEAPGATRIRLHFSRLETEARYDVVTLSSGAQRQELEGALGEVTSDWFAGDALDLVFVADYSVTGWGFHVDRVEYEAAPAGGELPLAYESSHPYRNGELLRERFTQASAQRVRLRFSRLETEANFDFVTLTGGGHRQQLHGRIGAVTSEWFPGDAVELEFRSDSTVTTWGFNVEALEYETGP